MRRPEFMLDLVLDPEEVTFMNDQRIELIRKQWQEQWQDYEQRGWIALYRAGRVNRVTGT